MAFRHHVLAAAACALLASGAQAQVGAKTPEQKRFYTIYKELVETNTVVNVGSCTRAATQIAASPARVCCRLPLSSDSITMRRKAWCAELRPAAL